MAKYDVTYICGHENVVELFGPTRGRDKKLERLAQMLCQDCYRKQELGKAKEAGKEMGLPELHGTEKQIAWAEAIRASMIEDLRKRIESVDSKAGELFARFLAGAPLEEILREAYDNECAALIERGETVPESFEDVAMKFKHRFEKNMANRQPLVNRLEIVMNETSATWFIDNR